MSQPISNYLQAPQTQRARHVRHHSQDSQYISVSPAAQRPLELSQPPAQRSTRPLLTGPASSPTYVAQSFRAAQEARLAAGKTTKVSPPPQSSVNIPPQITQFTAMALAPSKSIFEDAWRMTTDRFQVELATMQDVCSRVMQREEQLRSYCVRLQKERDSARERIGTLVGELEVARREAGITGSRAISVDAGDKEPRDSLPSPPSSSSSLPRSLLPFDPSLKCPSPSPSIASDKSIKPGYSPRNMSNLPLNSTSTPPHRVASSSGSSSRSHSRSASMEPQTPRNSPPTGDVLMQDAGSPILSKRHRRLPGSSDRRFSETLSLGERDMDIESDASVEVSANSSRSLSPKRRKVELTVDHHDQLSKSPLSGNRQTTPLNAGMSISHIDLVYQMTTDHWNCRACLKRRRSDVDAPLVSFPRNATWTDLSAHFEKEHPSMCAELARLGPSEVVEMRQRALRSDSFSQ